MSWKSRLLATTISLPITGIAPSASLASETEPAPDVCKEAVLLKKGKTSPCRGLLVPESEALEAAWFMTEEWPKLLDDFAKMEAGYLEEIRGLEEDLAKTTRALEQTRNDLLGLVPPPLPTRPWYEHPAFVASVGVLSGVGLAFLYVELKGD